MKRVIVHLDMNSYFATVEQQADVYLRGKPVGVIKALGRNCIIAASREAKVYGVKTGTSVQEALWMCPKIVLVPADMDKYLAVTMRLISIVNEYSPTVEVFSIDEVFMDVTESEKCFGGGVLEIVMEIKERIKKEIGDWLTCSVGISYNRILAKLASEQIKPDGIYVINRENLDAVFEKARLSDVCGLGPRIEKRLFGIGVTSFQQLRQVPREILISEFGGWWSDFLVGVSMGEGDDKVRPGNTLSFPKSVSRTYTTFTDLYSIKEVAGLVRNLCEEATWKLRKMGQGGRCVGLFVRGGQDARFERITVDRFLNDGNEVFKLAWNLFEKMKWEFPVRFAGVWISNLNCGAENMSLIYEVEKRMKLNRVMDQVNGKLGYLSLYPGRMMQTDMIAPEPNGYLGDKKFLSML